MIQEEYRELEKDLIDEQNNRYIEHDKGKRKTCKKQKLKEKEKKKLY